MTPLFKPVVFLDEGMQPDLTAHRASLSARLPRFLRPVLPPVPMKSYKFINYALGYRFEAEQGELEKIRAHEMWNQTAVVLRAEDPPLTFADLLGPELIPEVNPNQHELLRVEARVREAAVVWTRFFEGITD